MKKRQSERSERVTAPSSIILSVISFFNVPITAYISTQREEVTAKISGDRRRLKIFATLLNISELSSIIIPNIAVHIIMQIFVFFRISPVINGISAIMRKIVRKTEKEAFKKLLLFFKDNILKKCFASFSDLNSSLGMYSSNSVCSSRTSPESSSSLSASI